MSKISKKKVISYSIFLVFLIFFGWFLKDVWGELLDRILRLTLSDFFEISFFVIAVFLLNGLRVKVLTEVFLDGARLKFKEWFGLSMINTLGNYSPFQGGVVARGYYLKSHYKIKYSHFLSSMFATYFITFISFCLFSLAALLLLQVYGEGGNGYLVALFGLASLTGLIFIKVSPRLSLPKKSSKLSAYLGSFFDGWKAIAGERSAIIKLILIDAATALAVSLRYLVSSNILGLETGFLKAVVISLMANISMVINITPGGLGVRESVAALTAGALSMSAETGLLVSGLERAVIVFWVLVLGTLFSYLFARHVNNK